LRRCLKMVRMRPMRALAPRGGVGTAAVQCRSPPHAAATAAVIAAEGGFAHLVDVLRKGSPLAAAYAASAVALLAVDNGALRRARRCVLACGVLVRRGLSAVRVCARACAVHTVAYRGDFLRLDALPALAAFPEGDTTDAEMRTYVRLARRALGDTSVADDTAPPPPAPPAV
jgi:hypothetical protein